MKYMKISFLIYAGLFIFLSSSCVSTNVYEKTSERTYQDGKLIGESVSLKKDGKLVSKTMSEMKSVEVAGIQADILTEHSDQKSYDKTNIKLYKNGAILGSKDYKTKNGKIKSETSPSFSSLNRDDFYKAVIDYGDYVFVEGSENIPAFFAGKTEVTQAQYSKIMEKNPSENPGDKLPVDSISFSDALIYCNKLSSLENRSPAYTLQGSRWLFNKGANGYRLLTDEEFKYAAMGGSVSQNFDYSGSKKAKKVAWLKSNSGLHTHPVAKKDSNALGIFDMSGNVSEWVWSDYYSACGGSAWDGSEDVKVYSFSKADKNVGHKEIGFRVARNISNREKMAFEEKKKISSRLDSYFINAYREANKNNLTETSSTEDAGNIKNETFVEQVTVNSSPNVPYIIYSFLGKPVVFVGATAWNLVKCSGYALVNFIGGYSTVTDGDFIWVMPNVKKAKEKADEARKNNGISHYPEYHKAFTNNTIEVYSFKQKSENAFSKVDENQVKVYDEVHTHFDNSISVSRSIVADANSTASVIGWVGTGVTVPVSVVTWTGGALFGVYSSVAGN